MRPIDADALSKEIEEAYKKAEDEGWKPGDVARILCAIIAAPTLDLEPVRTGHWHDETWYDETKERLRRAGYKCSKCWRGTAIKSNYCPNCGARMDLEVNKP